MFKNHLRKSLKKRKYGKIVRFGMTTSFGTIYYSNRKIGGASWNKKKGFLNFLNSIKFL